jgi:hypothetical protein
MSWIDDPAHPFAGIAEKLKRANENIINLEAEIAFFIKNGEYPIVPKPNTEGWKEALAYHRDKPIPPRFSVLSGEIVHHLRSCLDHVVWHFSDSASRAKPGGMEFPVFTAKPIEKKELEFYARKVKGITNPKVLALIEKMQPYAAVEVKNSVLLVIHNMDRFDKHQELVIVHSNINVAFPPNRIDLERKAELYVQGKLPESEQAELGHALYDYPGTADIGFAEFGEFRPYNLIKGLSLMWSAVRNAVDFFADEI